MDSYTTHIHPWVRHHPVFESDHIRPELATSPWSGHRRFAYDLVNFVQPKIVLELGTHYGCSLFAFLQAVKDLKLRTVCYAVDTWQGDEHAGYYGEEVLGCVERIVQQYFSEQSVNLLRKSFDEAHVDISDNFIDILHIDGLHTYEAVKHDFETWEPKLAQNGVVLFHDIDPSSGYGSVQYWSELKQKHPHFEFLHHSWGLGILFPKGDAWYREIERAVSQNWEDLYFYQAKYELLTQQLSASEAMCRERWDIIQNMEQSLEANREALSASEAMCRERWDIIQTMEQSLEANREALSASEAMCRERWDIMQNMESVLKRLEGDKKDLAKRLSGFIKGCGGKKVLQRFPAFHTRPLPFEDLAFSLYLFIERLYEKAKAQGIQDLFFLSREGFLLKKMFDYFMLTKEMGGIKTHYLQASRRSSFLPSLGPVQDEDFEILFRQYRRISLEMFLKSLALDPYIPEFVDAIGCDAASFTHVREDLPTDPLFLQLMDLPLFQKHYEQERNARSQALENYIASFTEGKLPDKLCLVDVGWKGSIQDNLFSWFTRIKGDEACVSGYYIGLTAPGNSHIRNEKYGLLFSNQAGLTPGFHIFNENRSLFEVLLPAQHGSPCRYDLVENGMSRVMCDPFEEQEMIEKQIMPVGRTCRGEF